MTSGEPGGVSGRDQAGADRADGEARPEVLAELRSILAGVTARPQVAAISPGTPLFGPEVGLDSLTGTLLLVEVQQRFGVDVAAEDLNLDSLATLATLANFLSRSA